MMPFTLRPDINRRVRLAGPHADICQRNVDAIVNAANKSLLGGGGVDGAIHSAAGPELKKECRRLNGCETGKAKITLAYNVPFAKRIIHTVGPIGENGPQLESAYKHSLGLMKPNNLRSISFPCISTGVYGYPNEPAARVAMRTVREFLEQQEWAEEAVDTANEGDAGTAGSDFAMYSTIELVEFCTFLPIDFEIYSRLFEEYFPSA